MMPRIKLLVYKQRFRGGAHVMQVDVINVQYEKLLCAVNSTKVGTKIYDKKLATRSQ